MEIALFRRPTLTISRFDADWGHAALLAVWTPIALIALSLMA
ncbi:MAG: hypothetical protein ACK4F7_05265 [Inhella sp.]